MTGETAEQTILRWSGQAKIDLLHAKARLHQAQNEVKDIEARLKSLEPPISTAA